MINNQIKDFFFWVAGGGGGGGGQSKGTEQGEV